MKAEIDICINQGKDVASFRHKQVYFIFLFVAGVVNWLLLAKGDYMFSTALKKYTVLLRGYRLLNCFYG